MSLSELVDLVEDSSPNDSLETMQIELDKSVEIWEQKLVEATAIANDFEQREKLKIAIRLYDENDQPIPTWLENGFRLDQPVVLSMSGVQENLILISHAVVSLLKKQNIKLISTVQQETNEAANLMTNSLMNCLSVFNKKFVREQSIFVLKILKSEGDPEIELLSAPTPHFTRILFRSWAIIVTSPQKNGML